MTPDRRKWEGLRTGPFGEFRHSTSLISRVEETKERDYLVTGSKRLHVTERLTIKYIEQTQNQQSRTSNLGTT